ncbi:MAG TPA: TonB-dependent receptor [Caulobacteraceae bacterium]|jgi:iron complex outermembrane receptor protein|nr:TonB-dependent receptor [Caulobacteraceae bacterium]
MTFSDTRAGALALGVLALATAARAETLVADVSPLLVQTGRRGPAPPQSTASVTAAELAVGVNAVNVEDSLKYLPNLFLRKRHIGDTQAPLTTRTSGVGSSARSLVYADGVLLSALIGNNNSTASPKWGLIAPEEVERIDVLYGPFAAQHPGNSIGAVVNVTTRMPTKFEATVTAEGAWQRFSQYSTRDSYGSGRLAATLGDRLGGLSFWLSANHLDTHSQPLAYVTATRPATPSAAGAPVTGAYPDLNRTGAAIAVIGSGGLEHQVQDTVKLKLAYDLTPDLRAAYTVGWFRHRDDSEARTYLRDGSGAPAYAGTFNFGGYAYAVAASAFSNNVYRLEQDHWMQSLNLATRTGGVWDISATATRYDYGKDIQRTPSTALPGAAAGGAGTINDSSGTGWTTLDAVADWRPAGMEGPHQVSFGAHQDRFKLDNPRYAAADWISGSPGALTVNARGRTETQALWAQDAWAVADTVKLTLGARWEHWRAFDGFNYSLSPALSVTQPEKSSWRVSPKASLAWRPSAPWLFKASLGEAYRFPTVTELYQTVTTGAVLSVPNPNLRPERARSGELSVQRDLGAGSLRLSAFGEQISGALISQGAPLLPGSTALFNFVQNVDRVSSRGVELVLERYRMLKTVEVSASAAWVDSKIDRDAAFPAAVGKRTPQVPRWRATVTATWRPGDRLALSVAARYSGRVFGTIDNTDTVGHTYQGFDGYFVVDARASYQLDRHWNAAVGVDNLNSDKYFLFHPFPQRTVVAELKYSY